MPICRAQGYRTGLFTSPHLVTYRERIQVNGEMIAEEKVAEGLTSIRNLVAGWEPHPTFFEITTALALAHFKECACEVIVLETGLGGRLDATNAVEPGRLGDHADRLRSSILVGQQPRRNRRRKGRDHQTTGSCCLSRARTRR